MMTDTGHYSLDIKLFDSMRNMRGMLFTVYVEGAIVSKV